MELKVTITQTLVNLIGMKNSNKFIINLSGQMVFAHLFVKVP